MRGGTVILALWVAALTVACAGGPPNTTATSSRSLPPACPGLPADPDSVPGLPWNGVRSGTPRGARAPVLLNLVEARRVLREEFDRLQIGEGARGIAVIAVLVGVDGRVSKARIQETSGQVDLDDAALKVGKILRFRPAVKDGCSIPVWTTFPVNFGVHDVGNGGEV